jgi:hypothetical protein
VSERNCDFQQSEAIFGHNLAAMKLPLVDSPMIAISLPASSKIKLLALCFGSLLFLISGLRAGHSHENLQRRLLVPTGLAGLFYVVLELCWYSYVAFLQSREIALAYYFGFRLWGGVVAAMFLYAIFRNPKVFLAASAVLLVAFHVFVIARHLGGAMILVGHADGMLGGMLIASLVLLRLDQRQDQRLNAESAITPTTSEKKS